MMSGMKGGGEPTLVMKVNSHFWLAEWVGRSISGQVSVTSFMNAPNEYLYNDIVSNDNSKDEERESFHQVHSDEQQLRDVMKQKSWRHQKSPVANSHEGEASKYRSDATK